MSSHSSKNGSQSTLYGSVKSSKSSASFFGSCRSTDTIGSFHTARSISLSTLYFSAKNYGWGDDEDSKTLNWTMNIDQSFDELSDTSTLVGDFEDDNDKLDTAGGIPCAIPATYFHNATSRKT